MFFSPFLASKVSPEQSSKFWTLNGFVFSSPNSKHLYSSLQNNTQGLLAEQPPQLLPWELMSGSAKQGLALCLEKQRRPGGVVTAGKRTYKNKHPFLGVCSELGAVSQNSPDPQLILTLALNYSCLLRLNCPYIGWCVWFSAGGAVLEIVFFINI